MLQLGKLSQYAIAAVGCLAERWHDPAARVSCREIAAERNLPRPVAAKLLTALVQAGIVRGVPGPGGGFRLARPPRKITLLDVARLFEADVVELGCVMGPGYCGVGKSCPLHAQQERLRRVIYRYLTGTHFGMLIRRPPRRKAARRRSR